MIVMCPPERAPPSAMRLFAASATKPAAEHKADYVPGHIIGQLFQAVLIETLARVGGGLVSNARGRLRYSVAVVSTVDMVLLLSSG